MSSEHLAEVWGDIVDLRHLRLAVIIGALVSLGAYYGAVEMFTIFGDGASVDKAYAMLVGLGGCLVACLICARLFPPKRVLLEAGQDEADRSGAISALAEGGGDFDAPLPEGARQELLALGLEYLLPQTPEAVRQFGQGA